ncbi:MAG: alkyl hydroperoxide reductase [Myxococcota bacterium]
MDEDAPRWSGPVLWAAAFYNVAFGVFAGLFPLAYWDWIGLAPPLYPTLWQCIGMIVACYGVGYAFAARAPYTLWPVVLVGMIGKVLGPAGFVWAVFQGQLPVEYGWILITNDLIWWVPFGILCWEGAKRDVYFRGARTTRAERWADA